MPNQFANRISALLIAVIVVTVIMIGGVLLWMSEQHNKRAAENTLTMVEAGLAGLESTLQTLTTDYAYWEAAFDKVREGDAEWIYDNLGTAATSDSGVMDLMAIINPDLSLAFAWDSDDSAEGSPNLISPDLRASLAASLSYVKVTEVGAESQYAFVDDQLYLLSIGRLSPEDLSRIESEGLTQPMIVLGIRLDQNRLVSMGETYLIGDLQLADGIVTPQIGLPVVDALGNPLAMLVWTPTAPGRVLLETAAVPLSVVLAALVILALLVSANLRHSVNQLAIREKQSFHQARTDFLTKLSNRFHLYEFLAHNDVKQAAAKGKFVYILIDIDGFKFINDSTGHESGDILLKALADEITKAAPPEAFVSRYGGDEFSIGCICQNPVDEGKVIADHVANVTRYDAQILDTYYSISCSVGYAHAESGIGPTEVVRRADVAMFEAKRAQSGRPMKYQPEYEMAISKNKAMDDALRADLLLGKLSVVYQPIVELASHRVKAVEALARWESSQFGPVPPDVFIPIAEQSGLITRLGEIVFRTACQDISSDLDLEVSINISPVQLRDPNIVETFRKIAAEAGANIAKIEIELTEGVVVSHPKIAQERLQGFKKAGFSLSLDDFGTGFSSIGYLREFPFDKLKIDRSFIQDCHANPESASLIQAIGNLGDALDLMVVAEGVETADQVPVVEMGGCRLIQGFYYSKPLTLQELVLWCAERNPAA